MVHDGGNYVKEYILICEDSTEGILTGVYEAYQLLKLPTPFDVLNLEKSIL